MQTIDKSTRNFKTSPFGFLMSVIAKYQAYMQKNYETSNDKETLEKSKKSKKILDDLNIELSKIESLKKEPSNEAVLMHVIESFDENSKNTILEYVFEYLNLLDNVIQNIDKEAINEYYDVSRLGLILNCYLGKFENDDFFYGTLAEIAEIISSNQKNNENDSENIKKFCEDIISKIQKADINLSFKVFLENLYKSLNESQKEFVYKSMIKTYSESLLNKVLTQNVSNEDINKLACAKQIQRMWEKI